MSTVRYHVYVVVTCVVVCGGVASAGERFRTPAEIEQRRAEVAARLIILAEEETLLTAALVNERNPILEARVKTVAAERQALTVESRELAGIVTRTATGPVYRADPAGLRPVQIAGGAAQGSSNTAFNPAITVIPDGLYYNDNAGGVGSVPRGFSLREVELAFSGAVDPYFDVWAIFGIGDGAIEAEEVYVQTRRLLPGVQVRFGRFFSSIGYLNRQHPHQWDFVDQPLPYEALFGANLGDVGVQATWLPALPIYMQLGFEALQGDNDLIANQLADEYPELLDETPGPRLFAGFLKVSPDLGYSNTLQVGLSLGRSQSHQEAAIDEGITDVFDGSAWFVGTDAIWRHDSSRQYGQGDVTIQGEYFLRSKTLEPAGVIDPTASRAQQDGVYAQVVYGIGPRWTVGGRFDAIGLRNQVETAGITTELGSGTRYAMNVTFNPTEFSRLRVQYDYGRADADEPARIHQVYIQFQMSLGVHGAHAF